MSHIVGEGPGGNLDALSTQFLWTTSPEDLQCWILAPRYPRCASSLGLLTAF